VRDDRVRGDVFTRHAAIEGHADADVDAELAQRLRQRAGHVSEAAGLGERCHFDAEEEDAKGERGNIAGRVVLLDGGVHG
jgi:hypothetical protein